MAKRNRLAQAKADAKAAKWGHYIVTENDEKAVFDGCTMDLSLGQHVVSFCEGYCRLSEGEYADKNIVLMPWQKDDLIIPLFSWINPDKSRRFRRASIWLPKKNGKSQMVSILLLYGLVADGEKGARVYCAANKREQAAIVWDGCAAIVNASPELSRRLKVTESRKRISRDLTSYLEALSADAKSSDGFKAHMWGIDEIHEFDSVGQRLREKLRYAGETRRQPLELVISTAGDEAAGVGREEYEYAVAVATGKAGGGIEDTTTFSYIREATQDDDWTDPKVWHKANPSLGTLMSVRNMAADCSAAVQSPRLANQFKRYRLNLWTAAEETAIDMLAWEECGKEEVDAEALIGLPCCGGLDLSATTDLTAFALAFRHEPEDAVSLPEGGEPDLDTIASDCNYSVLIWPFLPYDNIADREREDRLPYRQLSEQGYLTLTPGRTIDYDAVKDVVIRECAKYGVQQVGYDIFSARKFAEDLNKETGIEMVEIPQHTKYLNAPSKLFEALILGRRLRHQNNPIANKAAADLSWYIDTNGNVRPMKSDSKKRRRRIDTAVATIMALSRASVTNATRSVYETRGMVFV